MNVSDPIADMLTRIRNGSRARHDEVVLPASRTKLRHRRDPRDEGFIEAFEEFKDGASQRFLRLRSSTSARCPSISGLKRVSKPGLRVYATKTEIPRVLGGLGVVIVSTSQGIMTGSRARKAQLGGEVLAYVW